MLKQLDVLGKYIESTTLKIIAYVVILVIATVIIVKFTGYEGFNNIYTNFPLNSSIPEMDSRNFGESDLGSDAAKYVPNNSFAPATFEDSYVQERFQPSLKFVDYATGLKQTSKEKFYNRNSTVRDIPSNDYLKSFLPKENYKNLVVENDIQQPGIVISKDSFLDKSIDDNDLSYQQYS